MPVRRSALLFFLSLSILTCTQAQYLFDNLKPKDGLSSREILSLYADEEGFTWMGTLNGLDRFDGSHVRVWNNSSPGYPSTLGERVFCITEFGKNKIWFGTNSGAAVFDKVTYSLRTVKITAGDKTDLGKVGVNQLKKDKQGRLWMASDKGVFIEKDGDFVNASAVFPFTKPLDSVSCFKAAFTYDSLNNVLWTGTDAGLFCIDLTHNELLSFRNNPNKLALFTNHIVNSIAVDRDNNIWFGDMTANALGFFNRDKNTIEFTERINDNPLWTLKDGCNYLYIDKHDRLWISTWLYTAFIRKENGKFEKIPYDENLPYSIGYGYFNEVLEDKYDNVWFATLNGASRFSTNGFVRDIIKAPSYPFFLTTNFANINTMLIDKKGGWWLGKMEGLVHYDTANDVFTRYVPQNGNLRWNEIFDLRMINNEIWCATGNGVHIFNMEKKQFRPFKYYPENKGQEIKEVSWIRQDREGFIWFSAWDDGVYRYNPKNNDCIRFDRSDKHWGDMSSTNSASFLETDDNTIWVSSGMNGIRIFDKNAQQFIRPKNDLNGDLILSMYEDRDHNIWLSRSQHGIIKLSRDGVILDSIGTKDGLPGLRFRNICMDNQKRLWAISQEALICINTATKQVSRVKVDVTFSFNDHWNSLLIDDDKLYATMLDNIVFIDTKRYQQLSAQAPPLISGFNVFQNDIPFSKGTPVQLDYKQNFFSIDFSSPFHHESPSIQYAYKLEGVDKDWVYCGNKQTAAYTNVPDGEYTFTVKSTNGSSKWMDAATSIGIIIQPPYWKTWWFLTFIAIAIILAAIWAFSVLQKRKQEKNIDAAIDYFANSVYGENSINEICWDIARNCISQLQFQDCVVYLLNDQNNKLVQKAAYGPKSPREHEIMNPIEIEAGKGIVGTVAKTGKPLLITDTTKDSRYIIDDQKRLSELAVPILDDGKVIGVIDSEHPSKNFFTEEHLKALTTIASISANKIAEAKAEALARDNEIKLLEIKKLLAESQLMALRAQMNPHFVFNCLNSIQECIVTQKYGEASKYLNKFSKLFRSVLNNSGKNLVSLHEEKDVLDLYLQLEQMRFEQSFCYEMQVDEELENDEILIPSMLLQPYVENALWHGLMHRNGERKLSITFTRISEDIFQCVIDDNGIGRKKSFELKEQQSKAKRHESKGLKISKDRIDVLQRQGYHALLDIIDKYDENGNANGTKVIVELSTFFKS
ncbi:MAG: histidine kinase [Chitinophagaceae bacterium]